MVRPVCASRSNKAHKVGLFALAQGCCPHVEVDTKEIDDVLSDNDLHIVRIPPELVDHSFWNWIYRKRWTILAFTADFMVHILIHFVIEIIAHMTIAYWNFSILCNHSHPTCAEKTRKEITKEDNKTNNDDHQC